MRSCEKTVVHKSEIRPSPNIPRALILDFPAYRTGRKFLFFLNKLPSIYYFYRLTSLSPQPRWDRETHVYSFLKVLGNFIMSQELLFSSVDIFYRQVLNSLFNFTYLSSKYTQINPICFWALWEYSFLMLIILPNISDDFEHTSWIDTYRILQLDHL